MKSKTSVLSKRQNYENVSVDRISVITMTAAALLVSSETLGETPLSGAATATDGRANKTLCMLPSFAALYK